MTRHISLRFANCLVVAAAISLVLPAAARATEVQFSLASGKNSAPISLPKKVPVTLKGNTTTSGHYGIGEALIQCVPNVGMQWVANSWYSAGVPYASDTSTTNTILFIDSFGEVEIRVFNRADCTIIIINGSTFHQTGTLIY
jgi:hypothetical protein